MAAKRNKQRQRRLRQQRRQSKRLLNPTPRQLRRERKAMARSEYRPVIKALQDDIRISKTNQRQLKQFYENYRGEVGTSADKSDANSQRLYQESRNTAADLGRRYDDKINKLAAEDANSAALRGAQGDSSNQQRSLAGESQRQNIMNADSKLLGQLGASSSAYLRNVALASNQGQRLDNRRERNRQQEARNKIREARKERNAKINALRSEQRGAEREWRLQKLAYGPKGYNAAMRDQSAKGLQQAKLYSAAQSGRGGGGGGGGGGRGGGGGGYGRGAIRAGMAQGRKQLAEGGISPKDPKTIRQQRQGILDGLMAPPNAMKPKLARIVYRRLLKRARRWNRNPKNVGSGAWERERGRR